MLLTTPSTAARARLPLLAAVAAVWLAAVAGCAREETPEPQLRPVLVQRVEAAREQDRTLRLAGRVVSPHVAQLAFQVGGRVERILLTEGQRAEAGAVLAELDPTDYRLQVRDATAQVRHLEADASRKRRLHEGGVLARAALDPVQARLESARVALATARRQLAHTRLEAPFAGTVARRLVPENTVVDAGTAVLVLQQDDVVDVRVDLPEWAAMRLPLGPQLEARATVVAGGAGRELALRYHEHGTQPDEGTRTYPLVLRAPRPPDMNLLPGMAMRVSIALPAAPAPDVAHALPVSAIVQDADGGAYVWVVADGGAEVERRDVVVREVEGESVRVETGLAGGEQVVVAGARRLHAGQRVRPVERD